MTLIENQHRPRRHRRKSPADGNARICSLVEAAVAASFAVPIDELRAHTRCRADVAFARQSAMYLAHVVLGLSYSAVGSLFARDRTTAAHACRLVEERRDDPATDRLLFMLEEICADLARAMRAPAEVRA
jgi:chromosomal replication initiation ATPase DnaA